MRFHTCLGYLLGWIRSDKKWRCYCIIVSTTFSLGIMHQSLTTRMTLQCRTFTGALHQEKLKSLLFPGPVGHGYKWLMHYMSLGKILKSKCPICQKSNLSRCYPCPHNLQVQPRSHKKWRCYCVHNIFLQYKLLDDMASTFFLLNLPHNPGLYAVFWKRGANFGVVVGGHMGDRPWLYYNWMGLLNSVQYERFSITLCNVENIECLHSMQSLSESFIEKFTIVLRYGDIKFYQNARVNMGICLCIHPVCKAPQWSRSI